MYEKWNSLIMWNWIEFIIVSMGYILSMKQWQEDVINRAIVVGRLKTDFSSKVEKLRFSVVKL